MSNGTRVLVTGSSGFIGRHLYDALNLRGYPVKGYDIIEGYDILDQDKLSRIAAEFKPTWIVHLAGQVRLGPALQDPQRDAEMNIIGTINILELARKNNCGVTFSSSGAVYGNNYQYPDPVSPYGVSKLTAETYCKLYHEMYGLHTVVFRFSSVYGYGRAPTSINLIVAKALKNEPIQITGDGSQTRDFTYVSDIVEALIMSAEKKFPSGVYDTGTGMATSINELIMILERLLNKKISYTYVPASNADPKRNELNVSKIANYGFKAKVSLEEGLKQLFDAHRRATV
jgi:UDP-glucose 4-epimerase